MLSGSFMSTPRTGRGAGLGPQSTATRSERQEHAAAQVNKTPKDTQTIKKFVAALDLASADQPRSAELEKALIATLAARDVDVTDVENFVSRCILHDLSKSPQNDADEITVSPQTRTLIVALLYHRFCFVLQLEPVLVDLRRRLLLGRGTDTTADPQMLDLAEAMARHSFSNEYLWSETSDESEAVLSLTTRVEEAIKTGEAVSALDLFTLAAYRDLYHIPVIRAWIAAVGQQDPEAVDPTLKLLVFNRLQEDVLHIDQLTPIDTQTSCAVRSQYEQNPYPRWLHMPRHPVAVSLSDYIARRLGQPDFVSKIQSQRPKVLIAGCGTGSHAIQTAQRLPDAVVLAVDLSRASLAYATRQARLYDVPNLAFAQADILKLAGIDAEFDLIESVGVLHHMSDPEAGLQSLLRALKPDGYMHLGLYSRAARAAIIRAREHFAASGYQGDLDGIRAFRKDLINRCDTDLKDLARCLDFHNASGFRDLVMHVQEHQFDLKEIGALLARNRLKFLGFAFQKLGRKAMSLPDHLTRRKRRDLKAWAAYERGNPDTFLGMYQFICQKR